MQKWGIDISAWQRGFDFDKAISEGVEFVVLRAAYSKGKDTQFDTFYKKCKERNIPVGAYHYSMAKTVADARAEAEFMIKTLAGKQFEYPIYLDVEDKTQQVLGKDTLTAIIQMYCDTLEKAGYYVGIYSTYAYLNSYTHIDRLDKYDKWIAQWTSKCTSKKPFGMWQFGGETNKIRTNKVAGVTCDQDYCYKDYPYIMRDYGLNGFGKQQCTNIPPAQENTLKSVLDVAREVLDGKWGNGAERKRRLTQAGYNYNEVQAEVNRLCKENINTVDEIAREVIQGKWGTGQNRKDRLTAAGYDYNSVQKRVNELM